MIRINHNIQLQDDELDMSFVTSSGPGGQHANRSATAVQLRFNVDESPSLPVHVKHRLYHLAGNAISSEGDLIIEASRYRSQKRNRDDAIEKLKDLIRHAAVKPKHRKRTRPTKASVKRRLEKKRKRGEKKERRRRIDPGKNSF